MRRRRSYGPRPIVTSVKNVTQNTGGLTGAAADLTVVIAKNTPLNTVANEVSIGCLVKAIYVTLDVCGIAGTGVLNNFDGYIAKDPGNNLTLPLPGTTGTSNEKKFIFKEWSGMIMRNQDGNAPLHWEGWIKIPKRYQRMGTDDRFRVLLKVTATLTGHFNLKTIYKWYR